MHAAERDCKLIAHPPPESTRLSEAEMVWIARSAAANEAGLTCDEPSVLLVAQPDALLEDRSAIAFQGRRRHRRRVGRDRWSRDNGLVFSRNGMLRLIECR